jgi:fibronectin type 3 domain-containing protein
MSSSGSTTQQHKVQLNWNPPSSSTSTITGYNVYRATLGASSYALLTPSLDTQMTYTDAGVLSGSTYNYVVTSVDSKGMESIPSDSTQVTIP